jgi:hypothetical protein
MDIVGTRSSAMPPVERWARDRETNSYPSDLTDEQWEQIEPLVPQLSPVDHFYGGVAYRERDIDIVDPVSV